MKLQKNVKGQKMIKRDILFKTDDFVFSYRVGGILIRDNKILLQKPKNDDGYSIIGGHIACMETAAETLKREFKEELGCDIDVGELTAVGEIFFNWGKRPCHQICLYFNVSLQDNSIPLDGVFKGVDGIGNKKMKLDFCWVDINDLQSSINFYPPELLSQISNNNHKVFHFISKYI